jgi:hypothetical protein
MPDDFCDFIVLHDTSHGTIYVNPEKIKMIRFPGERDIIYGASGATSYIPGCIISIPSQTIAILETVDEVLALIRHAINQQRGGP